MGKITDALKKAAEERLERIERIDKIRQRNTMVIHKMGDSKVDARIISYFDPKALITEQYKILRTNVLSVNRNNPPKVIAITSSIHSEGKTISALNLAVTVAQTIQKSKVLLIDADLRRGRMAKYLGVDQPVGLADVLNGEIELSEALFKIDIDNLTFMASGHIPENPSELLSSQKMKFCLSELKTQFDQIYIDCPPVISVADAGIVGSQVDGVILVIQAGRTQRGIIKRATELLNQTHTKILGYVLTNVEYHLPEYIYRYL